MLDRQSTNSFSGRHDNNFLATIVRNLLKIVPIFMERYVLGTTNFHGNQCTRGLCIHLLSSPSGAKKKNTVSQKLLGYVR